MLQEIKIKYFNELHQIGLADWAEANLLKPQRVRLMLKRMLEDQYAGQSDPLKKGLKKKAFSLFQEVAEYLSNDN